MATMQRDWDIFCRVIDNFGDIGVCWRLARQLATEQNLRVRLWVDDLHSLVPLCPAIDPHLPAQWQETVEICLWPHDFPACTPARQVVEAFACELPANYQIAMGTQPAAPRWFNLEYLSAENWASEWHGLVSPHPSLPLKKIFFFPGFSPASGGLLRENGLFQRRRCFLDQAPASDGLAISLFCYDDAPVGPLLDALIEGGKNVCCYLPPGKPSTAVAAHLGHARAQRIGSLEIRPMPFLPQDQYDELLWRCDINFVRGEDSFVRAQWAGKPFVWHIYRQEEQAHLLKLEAFINVYTAGLPHDSAHVFAELQRAWNTGQGVGQAWLNFLAQYEAQRRMAENWAAQLENQTDLVTRLINFAVHPV